MIIVLYTDWLSLDDVDENRSIDSILSDCLYTKEKGGKEEWPKPHNL